MLDFPSKLKCHQANRAYSKATNEVMKATSIKLIEMATDLKIHKL